MRVKKTSFKLYKILFHVIMIWKTYYNEYMNTSAFKLEKMN